MGRETSASDARLWRAERWEAIKGAELPHPQKPAGSPWA